MTRNHGTRPRISWLRSVSPHGLRFGALCGIAGPALFTAAWVVSSLRQTGHSVAEVQLSGLAAIDAHDPQIMIAGFVALGAGSIVFGTALGQLPGARAAGPRPVDGAGLRPAVTARPWPTAAGSLLAAGAGPLLVVVAGAAAVAAGVLRRDHMLLIGPGFAGESWHNKGHDIVSGVAYTAMIAAPIALARRFRADRDWAAVRPAVLALALVSGAALVLFASRAAPPWNGIVQRIAVTLALAAEVVTAARMLVLTRAGSHPRTRMPRLPLPRLGRHRDRPGEMAAAAGHPAEHAMDRRDQQSDRH